MMVLRRGPHRSDAYRASKMSYERKQFTSPVTILGPPLVNQVRYTRNQACPSEFGGVLNDIVWQDVVNGSVCQGVVECDAELLASSAALLSCVNQLPPERHFGNLPVQGTGATDGKFTEFLTSVTKAKQLMRPDGLGGYRRFDTSEYIDDKTKSIEVTLIMFEAENGIVTTLRIFVEIGINCKASYDMHHFNALEARKTTPVRWVSWNQTGEPWTIPSATCPSLAESLALYRLHRSACALIMTISTLCFCVLAIRIRRTASRAQSIRQCVVHTIRPLADAFIMGVSPCFYSIALLVWCHGSASRLSDKATQVLNVPWASNKLSFEDKLGRLNESLGDLEAEANASKPLHEFGLVLLLLLALRLVKSTQIHPRVGILLATIRHSMEDMLHFSFLVFIIYMCAACIGYAAFGSELNHFRSFSETVTTLINLTLGEWPEYSFEHGYKITAFTITFLILNFFVLLNFVIAIIVDAFGSAKRDLEADPTLCSVWSDMKDVMTSEWLRWKIDGWPNPTDAKHFLEALTCHTLTPNTLMSGFAALHEDIYLCEAKRRTMTKHWIQFYYRHDSCRAHQTHPVCVAENDPNQKVKAALLDVIKVENKHVVEQVSVMLDKPVPLPMVIEQKRSLLRKQARRRGVPTEDSSPSSHESLGGGLSQSSIAEVSSQCSRPRQCSLLLPSSPSRLLLPSPALSCPISSLYRPHPSPPTPNRSLSRS